MINDYESEARARWGNTDAYREHEQKTKNYTKEKWAEANDGLMAIFAEFAACKDSGASADSAAAKELVTKLQAHTPPTTTPAQTRFLQGLARCMSPTSGSKRISTSMARELRSLRRKPSRFRVIRTFDGNRFMKKHIANIITGSRIVFSLSLLFIPLSSAWFYALYLLCGLSDMIDGTVARRTNSATQFGARLDTLSDFVFMSVALIKFLPHLHIPVWLWIWIGIIAMIKLGNVVWGFVRTKKLISPHTILNKVAGLFLFLLPATISFIDLTYTLPIVCTVATAAAIHEVYDTYSEKKHDT